MTREATDERCPKCGSELMMYGEDKLCSDIGGAGRFPCMWNSWGGKAIPSPITTVVELDGFSDEEWKGYRDRCIAYADRSLANSIPHGRVEGSGAGRGIVDAGIIG